VQALVSSTLVAHGACALSICAAAVGFRNDTDIDNRSLSRRKSRTDVVGFPAFHRWLFM
jgi:hypothetical protein